MAIDPVTSSGSGGATTLVPTKNDADAADRFLKLLVAQMQNQDPLNPMDNAQVTTQMAQISTVDGITVLNRSVQALGAHFTQLQGLQAAALVGRDVVVPGDRLAIADGVGQGGFELKAPADRVTVEVLGPGGHVIDTLNLGAQGAGLHGFEWPSGATQPDSGVRFRVTATSGGIGTTAKPLMRDRVDAVASGADGLTLALRTSGNTPYSSVRAFN